MTIGHDFEFPFDNFNIFVLFSIPTFLKSYGCLYEEDGIAFRGTYIIDKEGKVRVAQVNDLPIGRSVDEVLRLCEAVQFNDKHGEGKRIE